jgi:hypothetical protein
MIAGFFLTETRIAWDGFALIPQAQLDEMWRATLTAACLALNNMSHHMMPLSRHVATFCEKMEACSLSCAPFHQFVAAQAVPFRRELMKDFLLETKRILRDNSSGLMTLASADEYQRIARFCLCEAPTRYPYEAKFVASIPMVLARIETTLEQWGQFSGKLGDRAFVEVYEGLLVGAISQIGAIAEDLVQVPHVGYFIASTLTLQTVLPYFDQAIQQKSNMALHPDNEKIRKEIQKQIESLVDRVNVLFRTFVSEMLNQQVFRAMTQGRPPHMFSSELVMFLETMSAILRPLLPSGMFLKIVERVAAGISDRYAEVIVQTADLRWNAELVWAAQQNLRNIENWPALITLPSAKKELTGISTMLSKLLSNQLGAFAADTQFVQTCKALPVDAMLAILQRYSQTKTKEHYVIPSNLVKSLIQKLTPLSKLPTVGKGKR